MVRSCYGLLFQKYDRLAKPSRFLHLRRFLKFPGVRDLRLSRAQLGAEAEDGCSKVRGTSGCGLRRITCKRVYQNSIETQEQIGAFRFTADLKGPLRCSGRGGCLSRGRLWGWQRAEAARM